MKKFILGFIIGAALFSAVGVGAATYTLKIQQSADKIYINGVQVDTTDPKTGISIIDTVNDRVYVPLRLVMEESGMQVDWQTGIIDISTDPENPVIHKEESSMKILVSSVQEYNRVLVSFYFQGAYMGVWTTETPNASFTAGQEYNISQDCIDANTHNGHFIAPGGLNNWEIIDNNGIAVILKAE